ncbi:MAG: glycosyltransferase [Spirochaetes bacterium]|nr:glycosyltransferase [Spirochaetota bacterium]
MGNSTICQLSVIIPAYNEGRVIKKALEKTIEIITREFSEFEIIVVNDGSTDSTDKTVRDLLKNKKYKNIIKLLSLSQNVGKGWAIKKGFEISSGKYIAFYDADLEIFPDHITRYLEILKKNKADAVVGSKRHPESNLEYSRLRTIISNTYYWFNRIFFGLKVRDTQSGMKVFKREILVRTLPKLLVKRFAFDLELLVNILDQGGKIIEAPLEIKGHTHFGTIGIRSLWHAFVDTMAVFYRKKILKYYDWEFLPKKHNNQKISIIIPVSGYSKLLQEIADKCLDQDYSDYEVLIVSDESNFKIPGAAVIASGKANISVKKNIGASRAKGSILAFIDQNVIVNTDWLSKAASYFTYPGINILSGPLDISSKNSFLQRLTGLVNRNFFVSGFKNYRFKMRRQRFISDALLQNFFIKKSVFKKVNGIDDKKHFLGESEFFCKKLADEGYKILYSPDIRADRYYPEFFFNYLKDIRSTASSRGFFINKYPESFFHISDFFASFFLIVLLFGTILSVFSGFFAEIYFWYLCGYIISLLLSSGFRLRLYINPLVVFSIIIIHFLKGSLFIVGLFLNKIHHKIQAD